MRRFRFIQLITGVHYIHHFKYSFGWKFPFVQLGYFKNFGVKKTNTKLKNKSGDDIKPYHNCSLSGVY